MENSVYYSLIVILIIVVCLWTYDYVMYPEEPVIEEECNKEDFFGGYYYPYDYPYYWPWFYSGCNEDVFGNIRCLPVNAHPFW
jgi:hypothetical protein